MNAAYHTAGKKGKKKTKNITTVKNASTAFNAFY